MEKKEPLHPERVRSIRDAAPEGDWTTINALCSSVEELTGRAHERAEGERMLRAQVSQLTGERDRLRLEAARVRVADMLCRLAHEVITNSAEGQKLVSDYQKIRAKDGFAQLSVVEVLCPF